MGTPRFIRDLVAHTLASEQYRSGLANRGVDLGRSPLGAVSSPF